MAIVTIEGSVSLPGGGGPSGGTITAQLSVTASDGSGNKVLGRSVFDVPSGGDLSGGTDAFTLVPNDSLTPSGSYYIIRYDLLDVDGDVHVKEEKWEVAGFGTQTIGDITVIE